MIAITKMIMKSLGFSELIKISGKSKFDQLTALEVGLMIEAFLGEGNEFFDPLAFNDFLHANLKNQELKEIQIALQKNSFLPVPKDGGWPPINRSYLEAYAKELRSKKGSG